MAFFALVAVLLVEQIYPLSYRPAVRAPLVWLAEFLKLHMNAGARHHAVAAWWVATGGSVLLVLAVYWALQSISPLLGGAWTVMVLYWALGFREFSNDFHQLQVALRMDDLLLARRYLAQWRGEDVDETLAPSAIASLAVETALLVAHRRVFGVLVCFVLLPGPAGAVFYRVSAQLADSWGRNTAADALDFSRFSRQAFALIDGLPARITAAVFAVVGDFENAIFCWRTQALSWNDTIFGKGSGIVLASGAGALGVRLGIPAIESGESAPVRLGVGSEADAECLRRVVGLLWRALLFWLLLLMLYGAA